MVKTSGATMQDAAPLPDEPLPSWEEAVVSFEQHLYEKRYRDRTIRSYGDMVRRFGAAYHNGGKRPGPYLSRLREADVRAFIDQVRGPGHWSARSTNLAIAALRRFARFLVAKGWQRQDIAAGVALLRISRRSSPVRVSAREIEAMKAAARSHRTTGDRDLAILLLLLDCGLRVGEVPRLALADVRLARDDANLVVRDTAGGERAVPLTGSARWALGTYLRTRGELPPSTPLFATSRGKALSIKQIESLVKGWVTVAGRPTLSAADLRHHCGQALYERTEDLAEVKRIMGLRSRLAAARYQQKSEPPPQHPSKVPARPSRGAAKRRKS